VRHLPLIQSFSLSLALALSSVPLILLALNLSHTDMVRRLRSARFLHLVPIALSLAFSRMRTAQVLLVEAILIGIQVI
jgi:hypothetical protein